jgi:hypothetical protein
MSAVLPCHVIQLHVGLLLREDGALVTRASPGRSRSTDSIGHHQAPAINRRHIKWTSGTAARSPPEEYVAG